MSTHSPHPSIAENGLADDCERCREHAREPFMGLDDGNMEDLVVRTLERSEPRSTNEDIAMGKVRDGINVASRLFRNGWRP